MFSNKLFYTAQLSKFSYQLTQWLYFWKTALQWSIKGYYYSAVIQYQTQGVSVNSVAICVNRGELSSVTGRTTGILTAFIIRALGGLGS